MFDVTRAWLRNPRLTGAVAASGPRLARAIAEEALRGSPRVVLEVGAGSGAVTRALVERMGPGQRLVALDINRDLLRLADVPGGKVRADAAFPPLRRADVVVSGLPLFTLPDRTSRRILDALSAVSPRIVLFQYTERKVPLVREYFPGARVVDTVYANLPPAHVVASPPVV